MKLVECVPNFSEGRDRGVLDALAAAITAVEGVRLLDVDPGAATNRTVFTFVGSPAQVAEAAFRAVEVACERIDMRRHRGAHPRLGAADVIPFVPLGEATMSECVELARWLGRRIGEELQIPVFLYEEAATNAARRSLSDIRQGEYEGLGAKLGDPRWRPDYGPAVPHERAGACVVGAREFLIAYNVNLNTTDRRLATRIAQNIRETGRPRRGADGGILRDAAGLALTEPGTSRLDAVRATGWLIPEYGRAQVSINLTNFRITPPHRVFEAVESEAASLGLRVTGSEVVGMIPLEALLAAGRHYLARQGRSPAAPGPELIRMAVMSLGLNDVTPFDPARKVIELAVGRAGRLAGMTVEAFVHEVAAATPAPGGGSVAALAAALSAALSAMVAAISFERKGLEGRRAELLALGSEAQALVSRMLRAVDADTQAFGRLLEAGRMPAREEAERSAREAAIQSATREAIDVPLAVLRDAVRAQEIAGEIADRGADSALSDAGVAALAAGAAAGGAWYNVQTNLPGLADQAAAALIRQEADRLLGRSAETASRVGDRVRAGLIRPPQSSPAK